MFLTTKISIIYRLIKISNIPRILKGKKFIGDSQSIQKFFRAGFSSKIADIRLLDVLLIAYWILKDNLPSTNYNSSDIVVH